MATRIHDSTPIEDLIMDYCLETTSKHLSSYSDEIWSLRERIYKRIGSEDARRRIKQTREFLKIIEE